MFQIKTPDELSNTLFIRRNPVFFLNAWLQLIPEAKFGNIENTEYKKAFLFPSRRNAFLYSVSLGVMIFFAAADPEGNCHEKCQQLGDGNGKPDTVRAEPQRKCYNGDVLKNNGLEERDY